MELISIIVTSDGYTIGLLDGILSTRVNFEGYDYPLSAEFTKNTYTAEFTKNVYTAEVDQ